MNAGLLHLLAAHGWEPVPIGDPFTNTNIHLEQGGRARRVERAPSVAVRSVPAQQLELQPAGRTALRSDPPSALASRPVPALPQLSINLE